MDIRFFRIIKLAFLLGPLILFMSYLLVRQKINDLDFVVFIIVTMLPLTVLIRHFQNRLAVLDRNTMLQIHDNQATRDSQILLMNIMEKLSDPLLILGSRNQILMANKSAHDLFGNHIMKQNIAVFIRNSRLEDAIHKAHKTGAPESCEFQFGTPVTKDYLTRIHLFNQDNDRTGNSTQYIFLALYDVSAVKRVDKMRVDFVANASHELRTPLTSILGFVETLQGPARKDDQAHDRFLKIMHDEASRMSRLIEDLLSLSRIERDEHILPSEKVDLPLLIKSVIDVLEPQAHDRNMVINFSQILSYNIIGDPDQLTQVFQNLIENAIKYGRENTEIMVTCTENIALASPESGMEPAINSREATITITNEGTGIPAKHLPRLMERFYRVDSARSRSLGGTGLGLAIVKHIIQRHRGRIFFESEINATTTVTLSLPSHI